MKTSCSPCSYFKTWIEKKNELNIYDAVLLYCGVHLRLNFQVGHFWLLIKNESCFFYLPKLSREPSKIGFIFKRLYNNRNGILLPKLFWRIVRKKYSSDREKLLKLEAEGHEFAKCLRSLEYWNYTDDLVLKLDAPNFRIFKFGAIFLQTGIYNLAVLPD